MLKYLGLGFTPRTDLRGALRSFACGDLRIVHGAFSSSPPPGRITLSSRFNKGNLSFKVAASSQVASSAGSRCHFTKGYFVGFRFCLIHWKARTFSGSGSSAPVSVSGGKVGVHCTASPICLLSTEIWKTGCTLEPSGSRNR